MGEIFPLFLSVVIGAGHLVVGKASTDTLQPAPGGGAGGLGWFTPSRHSAVAQEMALFRRYTDQRILDRTLPIEEESPAAAAADYNDQGEFFNINNKINNNNNNELWWWWFIFMQSRPLFPVADQAWMSPPPSKRRFQLLLLLLP